MDWVPPIPHHHHIIPAPITSFPHPSRHSRVGGNPTTPISSQHSPPLTTPFPHHHHVISTPITSFPRRRESYDPHIFTTPPTPSPHHSRTHHVIPTIITSFPHPSRHSRVGGNPTTPTSSQHSPPPHHTIPAPITSFPHPLRHSRVGGNPATPISSRHSPPLSRHSQASRALPSAPPEPTAQIPAYAGMTSKDATTGMTGEGGIYDLVKATLHDRGNGSIPCGALLGVVR